jgi:hypothetical protein
MTTIRRPPEPRVRTTPPRTSAPTTPATTAPARNEPRARATRAPGTADTFEPARGGASATRTAETFRRNLEPTLRRAGVGDAERTRIAEHLRGLSGAELQRETQLLRHAASSPNADRAINTYDRLLTMSRESPQAAQRLTPDIRAALVNGVADPRTSSRVGQEGILGQRQAEEAARALVSMPQPQFDQARGLLARAGQGANGASAARADAGAERSLILKSIAARGDRMRESMLETAGRALGFSPDTEASRAMREVEGFANEVRGMRRSELIRTTSVLDLSSANQSRVDPDNLRGRNDRRGNNDGLFQSWNDSCGPTTAQMMRGEADPVYARQIHRDGINNPSPTSATAQEQRRVLEADRFVDNNFNDVTLTAAQQQAFQSTGALPAGVQRLNGEAVSRLGLQARERVGPQLDAAQRAGRLTGDQRTALNDYFNGATLTPERQALADTGLRAIRRRDGGHPTAAEVNAMRADGTRSGNGMMLTHALSDITTQSTHINYQHNWVGNSGLNDSHLQQWDTRLRGGQDVPIRVSSPGANGGHFMMVSDVRGEGDNRRYLVSDPWSGRTSWMSRQDLTNPNSGALRRQFGLGWDAVSHFYTE